MHAKERVLQYQQYQLSTPLLCSVSHTYTEVRIILHIKRLRVKERNSVTLILHLGLMFQDNTQGKAYLMLCKKNHGSSQGFLLKHGEGWTPFCWSWLDQVSQFDQLTQRQAVLSFESQGPCLCLLPSRKLQTVSKVVLILPVEAIPLYANSTDTEAELSPKKSTESRAEDVVQGVERGSLEFQLFPSGFLQTHWVLVIVNWKAFPCSSSDGDITYQWHLKWE